MTRAGRSALLPLAAVSLLHGMNHAYAVFLSPLNNEIRQFFGADAISAVTSFKTTYLLVYAASNLLFGALTNRISARYALGLGAVLNAGAIVAFSMVGPAGIATMHVLWALAAIGGGTYHPVANALITGLFPGRKGWAFGITGMGASAGFAFGPLLTGFLSTALHLDWKQIAVVFGALGLTCAIAALVFISESSAEQASPGHVPPDNAAGSRFPISAALGIFVAFVVAAAGMREIVTWSVLDISDFFLSRAHETVETSWYLFLLGLPGIAVQPLAGMLSDRISRHRLAAAALALHAVSTVLVVATPTAVLFIPYLLFGIGQAASVPTIEAYVADYTNPRNRGLVFGFMVTAGLGLGALGPLFSGILVDWLGATTGAYRVCYVALGTIAACAALLMAFSGAVARRLRLVASG
ncbi:MAG: MFS transporter [Planctomycetes bacterium]|nr:MFS transporter [Planctomycetota bacterium]